MDDTGIRRHLSRPYTVISRPRGSDIMRLSLRVLLCVFAPLCVAVTSLAQGRGQRGAQTAKSVAPIDLSGYWVAVVSEDWRHRMTTPRKGDTESVPLNPEGRRVADTWDLGRDNQSGLQCK